MAELSAMMLKPEVQRTTAISETQRRPVVAATVENVFARLPGSESSKAILLLCHYDSVQNGPGASDDGAAVAAMLEAARALLVGPKLKNDVVFLFSDAEEVGQLGAQAFVDQSPMASDIGIVLNFEARGTGGPSIMFESSNDDGWLIEGLARAAPFPVANSLGPEVYKRLPNDTDLTIFKRNGFSGLNFAFIDGVARYHTKMDNLEEVDQASLQHHGSYMVSLARYFGNLNLEHTRSKNHTYFTLPGSILVHYRQDLALPLLALVTLLLIAMVVVGFKMKQLTFYGIFVGFMALLLSAACSAGGISLAWVLIRFVRNDYLSVSQDPAKNDSLYLLGFTVLAIAITLGIYGLLGRKTPVQDMIVGGLIWWLVGAAITSIYLPGTSFLFVWPLLFGILPLAYLFWSRGRASTSLAFRALLFLFAIPGFLLFVPIIYLLFLADFWRAISIIAVMTVFLGSLLSPALTSITFTRKWLLPLGAGLASIGLLTTALLTDRFDSRHPFTDNIFYAVNTVSGKAVWSTIDRAPDEWTSQFFAKGVETGSLTDCLPFSNARFMKSQAPTI
ncbi:MAG: M20/M25/M40 family metallo-hydrolase, partial [Blastocatellia bacterium]